MTFPDVFGSDGDSQDLSGSGPLTATQPYAVAATDNQSGTFMVTVEDEVDNASTAGFGVVRDTVKPTVSLTAPTAAALILITWAGADDLSGVRDYDVQYRHELSGTWATLIDDLPADNTVFTGGVIGESYYFRVRATDNVDNVGDWSAEVGPVEVTSGAVKKYYTFNGQRVAIREGDEVYYLSGDHLGSVSLTTDSNGDVVAESRYLPFGGPRWEDGISVTDFGFTSQREERGFGLIDSALIKTSNTVSAVHS